MALGKIKADTLEHSTAGSLDTSYVVNGSAKAWVNFNGESTVAIRDNLNVSSITDNGTGDYTINIASAMSNANYSSSVTASRDDTVNAMGNIHGSGTAPTSSALRIKSTIPTTTDAVDTAYTNASIHGDLA